MAEMTDSVSHTGRRTVTLTSPPVPSQDESFYLTSSHLSLSLSLLSSRCQMLQGTLCITPVVPADNYAILTCEDHCMEQVIMSSC